MTLLFALLVTSDLGSVATPWRAAGSFTFDGDTRTRPASYFDTYDCAKDKLEQGPEEVFEVEVSEPSDIDIQVEVPTGVDVDVHLLSSLARNGTQASDCMARADKDTTVFHVSAGTYYVVADTYGATSAKAGPFRLFVRVYPTARLTWQTIGRGVRWGRGSHDESAGFSTLNVIDIDPSQGAHLELLDTGHCNTLGTMTLPANVVAATNAGYFEGACDPDGLLRVNGTTLAVSEHGRYSVALQPNGTTLYSRPAVGADWTVAPSVSEGAGYFDLRSGSLVVGDDLSFGRVRHPRTVVGSNEAQQFLFALDGRGRGGLGATFATLGKVLQRIGADQGLNFDGGSSTTMWVRGEPSRGIVSFPSGYDTVAHDGVHPVGSLAVVVAEPVTRLTFVTLPDVHVLHEGDRFEYTPRAAVLSGSGVPTLSATGLPPHARFDGSALSVDAVAGDRGVYDIVLHACVSNDCAEQHVALSLEVADAPQPSGPVTTGGSSGGATGGGSGDTTAGGTGDTAGAATTSGTTTTPVTPQQQAPDAQRHSGCAASGDASAAVFAALVAWRRLRRALRERAWPRHRA